MAQKQPNPIPPAPQPSHKRSDLMGKTFKFNLGQTATIKVSGEAGEIIARAEYQHSNDKYLIRYRCADGRASEQWWDEDALTAE